MTASAGSSHLARRVRGRRAVGAVVWCAGLAVLAHMLWLLGRGPLAPPPVSDWSGIERWLHERTAVSAAFSLLRLVALAAVLYLLALTVLALCARLLHLPRLLRAVELSSLPAARRAIGTVAGLGLGASTTLVAVAPGAGAPARPPPAAASLPSADATSAYRPSLVIEQVRLAPVVLEEVRAPSVPPRPPQKPAPRSSTPPPRRWIPPAPDEAPPPTWVVRTGDHLWSVAAAHLGSVWGRPVTDAEIDPYWRIVVETNRSTLPDPTNPDLLFTGTTLLLPPVPPDPDPNARVPTSPAPGPGSAPGPSAGPSATAASAPPPPTRPRDPAASTAGPASRAPGTNTTHGRPTVRAHQTTPRPPTLRADRDPLERPGATTRPRIGLRDATRLEGSGPQRDPTVRPDTTKPSTPMVRRQAADSAAAAPTMGPLGGSRADARRPTGHVSDAAPAIRRDERSAEHTVGPKGHAGATDAGDAAARNRPRVRPAPIGPARPDDPSRDPPAVHASTDPDPDRPIVLEEVRPDTDDHNG